MFSIKVLNPAGFDLHGIMEAMHTQIASHLAPIWGTYADINAPRPLGIPVSLSVETKFTDGPGGGILGYHDVDSKGHPFIRVFVEDSQAAGVSVSSVISHEILEVLGDPFITSLALEYPGGALGLGRIIDAELCDPVENDIYKINGVEVSNFVTPWWFTNQVMAGLKFDYLGRLTIPFTLTPGGYYGYQDVTTSGLTPYQQKLGRLAKPWSGPIGVGR